MPTTPYIQPPWSGYKQWTKYQDPNKYLLTTNTSVSPEDTLWPFGLDFSSWDSSDLPRIFSCSPNHLLKLGSSFSHIFTSTLKARNISWCQCSPDFIPRLQLWNLSIWKLIIKKTSKQDAETWWPLPSLKSNTRASITTTLPLETTPSLA